MSINVGTTSHHFRTDIQGLRAVAVLVVIADHLIGWPHGGFVGVDMFFVISGFLITGLLIREYEKSGSISFASFYERRIKRIMPVALLVLGVTVVMTYPFWGLERTKLVLKDAVASAVFLGNWQFAANGVDYFQQDMPPSPLQHYWSLSVEEQFYFVWPWLMLGILWVSSRFLRMPRSRARLISGIAIAILSAASFAWAIRESLTDPTLAYFSTLSRGWELGIGALLAICLPLLSRLSARWAVFLSIAGCAGIVASLFIVSEARLFPAPWALLPVLSTALVIAAGTNESRIIPLLHTRPVQYLGDISYSLYLWHFPFVVLLPSLFQQGGLAYCAVGLALTFLFSCASYHWLEQPARRADWFRRSSNGRLAGISRGWLHYALACVLIVCGGAAITLAVNAALPPLGGAVTPTLARDLDAAGSCHGAAALASRESCESLNPADVILPRPADAARDQQGAYKCYIGIGQPMRTCAYGSVRSDAKRVALVGDSHAASMLPGILPQLEDLNWKLDVFIGNGCKWTLVDYRPGACDDVKAQIQNALIEGDYDLIIATGTRTADATTEMHRLAMEPLLAMGRRIVVVEDNPDPSPESIACVQRVGFSFERGCSTAQAEAVSSVDTLAVAAKQLGVPVVNQERLFCLDGQCPSAVGNVIVYKDIAGHVTASYSKTVGPYLIRDIQEAVGEL